MTFRIRAVVPIIAGLAAVGVIAVGATAASLTHPAREATAAPKTAPAQASPRGPLPPAVARLVTAWGRTIQSDMCSGPGFRAEGAPTVAFTADFNGDGQTDYVVGLGGLQCWMDGEQAFSIYGPYNPWAVMLSSPQGYRQEDFQSSEAWETKVSELDGRPVLLLSDVGPGAFDHPVFSYAWGWDGAKMTELAFYDENGRRVTREGGPWRAAPAAAAPSGPRSRFLPLPVGYYALNGDCGAGAFDLRYLGDAGIELSDVGDAGCRYVESRTLADGRVRTTERCPSEEGGDARQSQVWRVTADGFRMDEPEAATFRFCPTERLPRASRFHR